MIPRAALALGISSSAIVFSMTSDAWAAPSPSSCHAFAVSSWGTYSAPPPEVRTNRLYSVRCFVPNVSEADMTLVAQKLADGATPAAGYKNQLPSDYTPFGLRPVVRFHDSLRHEPAQTTLTVNVWAEGPISQFTKFCTSVNQSGIIAKGQNMDREYKCRVQIRYNERDKAQEIARQLVSRDMLAEARSKSLRLCLQPTTDIQCAPCMTSDKLVVRIKSVAKGAICPAGTIGWAE